MSLIKLMLDALRAVVVENKDELRSAPLDPGRWRSLRLSSAQPLCSFETSMSLFHLHGNANFPTLQPSSVYSFRYMLDLISELPRSLEEISIFLRLEGHPSESSVLDVISQDYDWGRLASIIYSLPAIQAANIVLIARWNIFETVASQCRQIVKAALCVHTRKEKEREVIEVVCHIGDYDRRFY
ncbi:hypothetical protein QCA50_008468 [Cerrena zonata]|uniref:Uncharacterized protein n=1 Tax=Cerrena zonata TaxID=2478898 RepID=A0AAW0GDQ4_9APHY